MKIWLVLIRLWQAFSIDLSGWYFRFITGFTAEWEEWEHFMSDPAFLEALIHLQIAPIFSCPVAPISPPLKKPCIIRMYLFTFIDRVDEEFSCRTDIVAAILGCGGAKSCNNTSPSRISSLTLSDQKTNTNTKQHPHNAIPSQWQTHSFFSHHMIALKQKKGKERNLDSFNSEP